MIGRRPLREDIDPGADHMMIVDSNNIVMRSLFGMEDAYLVGPTGVPSGGVFGVINSFRSYVAKLRPTHTLWVFDDGKSSRRVAMYPEYKAQRDRTPKSVGPVDLATAKLGTVSAVREFFNAYGVAHFSFPGVEADDLIAEAVRRLEGKMAITIVSADHDMLQLCSADGAVRVLRPGMYRNPDTVYDARMVEEKYGLPPQRCPEIWAIQGDTADNIKGVPQLGQKRSLAIIQKHGSLATALAEEPRLHDHREVVELNHKLIDLTFDRDDRLPEGLEQCRVPTSPLYPEALAAFIGAWGFESLSDML